MIATILCLAINKATSIVLDSAQDVQRKLIVTVLLSFWYRTVYCSAEKVLIQHV